MEQAQHLLLEFLLSLGFVDIDTAGLNLGQRIQMGQLVGGLISLEIVGILLSLRLEEQTHLDLRQGKFTLRTRGVALVVHGPLEVDELASLVSSQVGITVGDFVLAGLVHDLDLDVVVAARVLEVAEVLQKTARLQAFVIFCVREQLDLELAIWVELTVLDLHPELIGVVRCLEVVELMQVDVDHLDVEVLLGINVNRLKFMEVIVNDFLVQEALALESRNDLLAPSCVAENLVRGRLLTLRTEAIIIVVLIKVHLVLVLLIAAFEEEVVHELGLMSCV